MCKKKNPPPGARKEGSPLEANTRIERQKRKKNKPKRNKLETGLVTLRAFADFSRVTTFLKECWDNF